MDVALREDEEAGAGGDGWTAWAAPSVPVRGTAEDLAGKLQLTRIVLGCSTHKELAARFAQVNRATAFTPQSAYKWLRGKATPRTSSIYQDWSRLLDGKLAAPFVAAASFEEFAQALCRHFPVPEAAMAKLRGAPPVHLRTPLGDAGRMLPQPVTPQPPGPRRRASPLAGAFLALTPGWPPSSDGRLGLSAVRIVEGADGTLAMEHCQRVLGRLVTSRGALVGEGRTLQAALHCPHTGRIQFLSLHLPVFPAYVMVGLICGTALNDAEGRAFASRILLLRSLDAAWEALPERTGMLAPDAARLADELARLGYGEADAAKAASATLLDYFAGRGAPGALQVTDAAFRAISEAVAGLAG